MPIPASPNVGGMMPNAPGMNATLSSGSGFLNAGATPVSALNSLASMAIDRGAKGNDRNNANHLHLERVIGHEDIFSSFVDKYTQGSQEAINSLTSQIDALGIAAKKATGANQEKLLAEQQKLINERESTLNDINEKSLTATANWENAMYKQLDTDGKKAFRQKELDATKSYRDSLVNEQMMSIAMMEAEGKSEDEIAAEKAKYAEKISLVDRDLMVKQSDFNALNYNATIESVNSKIAENGPVGGLISSTVRQAKAAGENALGNPTAAIGGSVAKSIVGFGKDPASFYAGKIADSNNLLSATQEKIDATKKFMDEIENDDSLTDEEKQQQLAIQKEALNGFYKEQGVQKAQRAQYQILEKMYKALDESFKRAESLLTTYLGPLESRLQGSEKNYKSIMDKVTTSLAINPYVKVENVLEAVKEASDKGIIYNLEQRAFLSSVSDKIASTFDAFDSNLARLIRLQQADTTAARLGMEAALTKFLNGYFNDSSYLSEVTTSNITTKLIEATSMMEKNASLNFEFAVQKWLGSLSSLGMDSSTLDKIAEGITYLATGDVTNLSNNSSLQTLLAMSASKANMSYSDMLIQGINSSDVNQLMSGMVIYLKEIANNSDNNVVRAAYGDVFDLSMSDMRAISNMTAEDVSQIASLSMDYSSMMSEVHDQMTHLYERTTMPEMLDNIFNNATLAGAVDLMNNPVTYSMYKVLEWMRAQDVDMNIPSIGIMGNVVDLEASVGDLMNMGLQFANGIAMIANIVSSIGSGGGMNLESWGYEEYNTRGGINNFLTSTQIGGKSGSIYVASGSSDDVTNSTLSKATDDAEETSKITNKNHSVEKTFDDFYKAVVRGDEYIAVGDERVRDILELVYRKSANFIEARDGRMSFGENSNLLVYDSNVRASVDGVASTVRSVESSLNRLVESDAFKVRVVNDSLKTKTEITSMASVSSSSVMPVSIKNSKLTVDLSSDSNSSNAKVITSALYNWMNSDPGKDGVNLSMLLQVLSQLIDTENTAIRTKAVNTNTSHEMTLTNGSMATLAQYISDALN